MSRKVALTLDEWLWLLDMVSAMRDSEITKNRAKAEKLAQLRRKMSAVAFHQFEKQARAELARAEGEKA